MDTLDKLENKSLIEGRVEVPVPLKDTSAAGKIGTLGRDVADVFATNPAVVQVMLGYAGQLYSILQVQSALYHPSIAFQAYGGGSDANGFATYQSDAGFGVLGQLTLWDRSLPLLADRERFLARGQMMSVKERGELAASGMAEAYDDVIRDRRLVDAAERQLHELNDLLDTEIQPLIGAGEGDKSDVAQAQGRIKAAEGSLAEAIRLRDDAEARYAALTGRRPGELTMPAELPVSADKNAEVARAANHPSIQIIAANIQAAIEQAKAVDAEKFGRLAISAGPIGWSKSMFSGVPPWNYGSEFLMLAVPLIDSGERSARLLRAVSTVQVSLAQLDDTRRSVTLGVEQAYNAWVAAKVQKKAALDRRDELEKVRTEYVREYRFGLRSVIDLLNAEAEAYQAESIAISAELTEIYATQRLYASQGRLLKTLGAASYVETPVSRQENPWINVALRDGLFVLKDPDTGRETVLRKPGAVMDRTKTALASPGKGKPTGTSP